MALGPWVLHLKLESKFIKTDERSPLSYLVNPLMGYFYRAFREG